MYTNTAFAKLPSAERIQRKRTQFQERLARNKAAVADEAARWQQQGNGAASSFSSENLDIARLSLAELVAALQTRRLSVAQVVASFGIRVLEAHDKLNCLTEAVLEDALKEARDVDATQQPLEILKSKPLFGVPFSVKDNIDLAGCDSSLGFSSMAGNPREQDAALVTILRNAGAIPICKSNVPQSLLSFECSNPLFGATSNPYNIKLTCGGSSGAEAAILAENGAVFGIGTDIGGSLRIPAGFCGIYSLKPTYGRFPSAKTTSLNPGLDSLNAVIGPMARSVDDLELVTRVVLDSHPERFDVNVIPLPFRPWQAPKKLRIGYYCSNGFIRPTPACRRATEEAVEALRKEGHEVFEFPPPLMHKTAEAFASIVSADGAKTLMVPRLGDPMEATLRPLFSLAALPAFVVGLLSLFFRYVTGDSFMANFVTWFGAKSVFELWKKQSDKNRLRQQYHDIWNQSGVDCVICPVGAFPPPPHGSFHHISQSASYTYYYNVHDTTVGVVPVTRVDKNKDAPTSSDLQGLHRLEKEMFSVYDLEVLHGGPLGVQVVGGRWEEEKVLGIMRIVDNAVKKQVAEK